MRNSLFGVSSALALGCAAIIFSAPASAYTACHSSGDCWHADSKAHFKGEKVSYHKDNWWDAHKSDTHYHWHEADKDHDANHGYWKGGEWHHD
jgi:hypothetical protein